MPCNGIPRGKQVRKRRKSDFIFAFGVQMGMSSNQGNSITDRPIPSRTLIDTAVRVFPYEALAMSERLLLSRP